MVRKPLAVELKGDSEVNSHGIRQGRGGEDSPGVKKERRAELAGKKTL
jgi:hypothetical protein